MYLALANELGTGVCSVNNTCIYFLLCI